MRARLLRVDLTSGQLRYQDAQDLADRWIGGRGVGDWIVFNEVSPGVSPLDPQNVIAVCNGGLTGTQAPSSSRTALVTKNAITNGICTSNVGGHFGAALSAAGIDYVLVSGASAKPVYLWIFDGRAEIRPADHLWGMTTRCCAAAIRQETNDEDAQVASIGPAGENLVLISCVIVHEARAAGWGGIGAVFGSKNLKAIAVSGASSRCGCPSGRYTDEFANACRRAREKILASRDAAILSEYGTMGRSAAGGLNEDLPQTARNLLDEVWQAELTARVKEKAFRDNYLVHRMACYECPIGCSRKYAITNGKRAGIEVEGIQSNTHRAFTSNLDIADPEVVIGAQAILTDAGLDVDGSTAAIAWAMDCIERGILRSNQIGVRLRWGDGDAVLRVLGDIAYRKGFGDLLAGGVARAAERIGGEALECAMHVKGAGINEQGVRSHKAWALGIITSTRGGGHLNGAPNTEQKRLDPATASSLFGVPTAGDPCSYEGKGTLVKWFEDFKAVVDSLGLCYFGSWWSGISMLGPDDYAEMYSASAGKYVSAAQLLRKGEVIYNVEKAFNTLHAGFTRVDDYPPRRLMTTPVSSGPFKGAVLDLQGWNKMLDDYYMAHGWDIHSGWQTEECLVSLGLSDVGLRLANAGRLVRQSGR